MSEEALHSLSHGLWQSCVDQLAQELPEQQFNTWIRPLVVDVVPDLSKVTIQVGNRFKLDWIRAQYAGRISALLEKLTGQKIPLELALAIREAPVKSSLMVRSFEGAGVAEPVALGVPEEVAGAPFKNRLNTALTFDTLIEGTANRMGRAAALHVSSSLGQLYNPLFIYGGVGLGKTHLMHAIGNKLLGDNPAAKVLYIHA
ncbi:MAG: chromosomal replication initiation protein DnaA, partial [Polaromonas sp. 39-63-203]